MEKALVNPFNFYHFANFFRFMHAKVIKTYILTFFNPLNCTYLMRQLPQEDILESITISADRKAEIKFKCGVKTAEQLE